MERAAMREEAHRMSGHTRAATRAGSRGSCPQLGICESSASGCRDDFFQCAYYDGNAQGGAPRQTCAISAPRVGSPPTTTTHDMSASSVANAKPAGHCVFSWGGGDMARGWHGRSGGAGPAKLVQGQRIEAVQIAASRNSLAIASNGSLLTWGLNDSRGGGDAWFVRGGHGSAIPDSGQLGRPAASAGARMPAAAAPAPVVGELAAEGTYAIASGRYHALAIGLHSRSVYSWGLNDVGQSVPAPFEPARAQPVPRRSQRSATALFARPLATHKIRRPQSLSAPHVCAL